jgi:hypothetical protein
VEGEGRRFLVADGRNASGSRFCELTGKDEAEKLVFVEVGDPLADSAGAGGLRFSDLSGVASGGLLNSYSQWADTKGRTKESFERRFSALKTDWNAVVDAVDASGRANWEPLYREDFERLEQKKEGERSEADRLVVVGMMVDARPLLSNDVKESFPKGIQTPVESDRYLKPCAVARVVKETPSRFYIECVVKLSSQARTEWCSGDSLKGGGTRVDRDRVMADHARTSLPGACFGPSMSMGTSAFARARSCLRTSPRS